LSFQALQHTCVKRNRFDHPVTQARKLLVNSAGKRRSVPMENPLPCRACGNEAVLGSVEIGGTAEARGLLRAWVSCSSCMRRTHDYDTLEEALAAWNQGQRILQLDPDVSEKPTPVAG
jgi:hypothetical protein